MPDTFVILYEDKVLVVLQDFKCILPNANQILDWYAKEYAFERNKLSGCFTCGIDISKMKYEDFLMA